MVRVGAAILCGGRGERLRPLTDFFQKTMIPIGPKKRPLLEYIVRLLAYHGVKDVTMLTSYRTQEISAYFKDGSSFGVTIGYSRDREGAKGSLNAVANAIGSGSIPPCDVLLIYYGDVLSDLNVRELISVHEGQRADATLVLARGYRLPVGVAEVEGRARVVAMKEKPTLDVSVTTGCMTLGPTAMKLAVEQAGRTRTDLMTHFVPYLLKRRARVAAYYTKGLWYDVGTVASYEKLNAELKDDTVQFARKATKPKP
ncbi:MAG: nucleotidyltransferase family protein [Nitrososphaerales archaeon]|nr:nucleotidyltransferase family protein [Nitrososphaerales archaeon]